MSGKSIAAWCDEIHEWAAEKGFYPGGVHASGSTAAQLMLVVSELAEAMEADRARDRDNFREEIADAVIRLFDLCEYQAIDLEAEIARKMEINRGRPQLHGKAY